MSSAGIPSDRSALGWRLFVAACLYGVALVLVLGWLMDEAARQFHLEDFFDSFHGGVAWAFGAQAIVLWVRGKVLRVAEASADSPRSFPYYLRRIGSLLARDLTIVFRVAEWAFAWLVLIPLIFFSIALDGDEFGIIPTVVAALGGLTGWAICSEFELGYYWVGITIGVLAGFHAALFVMCGGEYDW